MREADRKLVWSVVIVLAVIALELAWYLFVGPTSERPDYGAHCNSDCYLPWWNSAATWTAIFTAILTGSTILLWLSTRKSSAIAERALTEQERPWLFLETVQVTRRKPPPDPNEWYIEFHWKNVGRMPAVVEECIVK